MEKTFLENYESTTIACTYKIIDINSNSFWFTEVQSYSLQTKQKTFLRTLILFHGFGQRWIAPTHNYCSSHRLTL